MNLIDPDTILEFQQLVGEIETDENLRVVVLESEFELRLGHFLGNI